MKLNLNLLGTLLDQFFRGAYSVWALGGLAIAFVGIVSAVVFEAKRPRLYVAGIVALAAGLVIALTSLIVAAAAVPSTTPQLQEQASKVYGLNLSPDQADALLDNGFGLTGTPRQQLGSSYVKTDSGIEEITLIYIDNEFVLVKDGTHSELPRVQG